MGNMSYCQFQNTLSDLHDCYDAMEDDLSEDEQKARLKLIQMCRDIGDDFGDEVL